MGKCEGHADICVHVDVCAVLTEMLSYQVPMQLVEAGSCDLVFSNCW